jgi:excisionase family DNA binding protein
MPFQGTAMPAATAELAVRKYFRVAEVAALFEIDETTVCRQIKAGRLKAIRIGSGRGTIRIPAAAVIEYEASITASAVAEVA